MQQQRQITTTVLLAIFVCAATADARLLGRRRGGSATGSGGDYTPTEYSTEKRYTFNGTQLSLQDIAVASWVYKTDVEKRSSVCNDDPYRTKYWDYTEGSQHGYKSQ